MWKFRSKFNVFVASPGHGLLKYIKTEYEGAHIHQY